MGAAIFGADHRIVMTGHNGAPAGHPHCLDGACPRGRHYGKLVEDHRGTLDYRSCGCGNDWPCPEYVDPLTPYDKGPGLCIGIHAEANAIIYADHDKLAGAVIYITRAPCHNCTLLIQAAGIQEVVVP